jgi:Protein of unknown function (DUF2911)
MRKLSILTLCTLIAAAAAVAQEAKKPLSPKQQVEYTSNGKKVTIDYSAPSMRGRKIMGELVPYGQVWRTGANQATTLTTSADLMIGTLHVPAGTYTLFTLPGEKEWTLIVNKQTGQWGTTYDQAQDLGRVKMKVVKLKDPVEQFAIGIDKTLAFSWENTKAWVPVVVH